MARLSRTSRVVVAGLLLLALASAPMTAAETLSNLPDLSTATETTASSTKASSTAASTKAASTTGSSAATTTDSSSGSATTSGTSTSIFHLTGLPTVEGAGIPTLVIPYTAAAPFMQKSNLPEGTVFITVGAILGFLGFCVIAWRAMVAYTINRSVKKAAIASIMSSDTKAGWMSNTIKPSGGFYSAAPDGSSLSLDALTSSGKPLSGLRNSTARNSKVVPSDGSGLFFSPTASQGPGASPMAGLPATRSSAYLPAGYYATPSAQAGGGAQSTTLGSNLSPGYQGRARSMGPSPPESPGLQPRRTSQARNSGLQLPGTRDGGRSRPTSTLNPNGLYSQPSSSSLAVGTGIQDESLPGSRAPSAYLEDLFENHGNGPRERF